MVMLFSCGSLQAGIVNDKGDWALDVATKIGVNVASGAMKSVLGKP